MHKLFHSLMILLILSYPSIGKAQENSSAHDWNLEIKSGLANDSTIIVEEIDNISSEGGDSATLNMSARYRYEASDDLELSGGYTYSTKNYRHTSDQDTQLHILTGSLRHKWQSFSGGIRAHKIKAELGNQDFLDIKQVAPFVSFFISKYWYLDLSYRWSNKDVITDDDRSGKSKMFSGDVYYLLKGTKQFWQFGARIANETADNPTFSHHETEWRAMYVHTIDTFSWENEIRLSLQRQTRDFDTQEDPAIEKFRLDTRRSWELEVRSHLTENLTSELIYSRTDNDSNNPLLSYKQKAISLAFEYRF